ncbi:YolD-like family protein [Bacillus sp. REN16]|uniref:YolD-like family protein n=1 Tax=Bacillus sp. REN16 TaxID=2887296 RepID=UPI001E59BACB|nr:YolD-like family protein [Bacillus sp. REN16]MCC3358960.1 YolD-like family protein [Bacillus sp. REN16]
MIKDRGKIKWGAAFMLPEMISVQSRIDWDAKKVERPTLDENQLEEINQAICTAMEFNQDLVFTLFDRGEFVLLLGRVHYVDQLKNELRIVDKFEELHYVKFKDIVKVNIND